MSYYRTGDELLCDHCDRVLYRLTQDALPGDIAEAALFERVDGVHPCACGVVVECPEHGPIEWPGRWHKPRPGVPT